MNDLRSGGKNPAVLPSGDGSTATGAREDYARQTVDISSIATIDEPSKCNA